MDYKWPFLLIEGIFLMGGIILLISGVKIRKQGKSSAVVSIITGAVAILTALFLLYVTFIFGYNS